MSKVELNTVSETTDIFGYAEKALEALEAYEEGLELKRYEIMGDCMFFEGLCQIGLDAYVLELGS